MRYRLFIAVELPEPVKQRLADLRAPIPGAAWVSMHAFHVTLRFVGDDIDEPTMIALRDGLTAVRGAPFAFSLRGAGRFPPGDRRPPRVLWIGISAPPALLALQAAVERAVIAAGFPPEARSFSPHLTLARLKHPESGPAVEAFIRQHDGFRSEPIAVDAFHLIASTLTPSGAQYRTLRTYPLGS
ncbi:MAG: RNA 2',3'-cyclic phosphodiesterase [Anaerolinea sp.]|nr:RNA 2',3'-cyclic phosphodiesterase [Anaerolinea sp.]